MNEPLYVGIMILPDPANKKAHVQKKLQEELDKLDKFKDTYKNIKLVYLNWLGRLEIPEYIHSMSIDYRDTETGEVEDSVEAYYFEHETFDYVIMTPEPDASLDDLLDLEEFKVFSYLCDYIISPMVAKISDKMISKDDLLEILEDRKRKRYNYDYDGRLIVNFKEKKYIIEL